MQGVEEVCRQEATGAGAVTAQAQAQGVGTMAMGLHLTVEVVMARRHEEHMDQHRVQGADTRRGVMGPQE